MITQWSLPITATPFVVDSEDGSKHTTFQVIATYVDALETFSITGTDGETYTGTPVDTNRDDVAGHRCGDSARVRYFGTATTSPLRTPS